jgi:solute carrier family 25 citrate transporter 1
MSAKSTKGPGGKKPASAATNLVAGGGAGMMEALACHPLDTIKVRMQLSKRSQRGVSYHFLYSSKHTILLEKHSI